MYRKLFRRVWPPGMIVTRFLWDRPYLRKLYRIYVTRPTRRALHSFVGPFLPQFLHSDIVKRMYYRFSEFWWEHPSNGGHALFVGRFSGSHRCLLEEGQRCLFCGGYMSFPVNAEKIKADNYEEAADN